MITVRGIAILGCTGSIGRQTLKVLDGFSNLFFVEALAAGANWQLLKEQIIKYKPRLVSVAREEDAARLKNDLIGSVFCEYKPEIYWGQEGLVTVATSPGASLVLTAVTGTAGLLPTIKAIEQGKDIALANKETLVAAGRLVTELAAQRKVKILPVDSEHSAIWQCLGQAGPELVSKLLLTASGGPFRNSPSDLEEVTVEMALAHPNWNMGKKITIDSATLMNKGLEVIEARWLFGVDYEQIEVIVHPQSIIHSMVEFKDGSVLAQLGLPDMRLPIQYALTYPSRLEGGLPRLDWKGMKDFTFEPPNLERFPLLGLAYQAGRSGGTWPAALNAANEVAVDAFLNKKIKFTAIHRVVASVLDKNKGILSPVLEEILEADSWARQEALSLVRDFSI